MSDSRDSSRVGGGLVGVGGLWVARASALEAGGPGALLRLPTDYPVAAARVAVLVLLADLCPGPGGTRQSPSEGLTAPPSPAAAPAGLRQDRIQGAWGRQDAPFAPRQGVYPPLPVAASGSPAAHYRPRLPLRSRSPQSRRTCSPRGSPGGKARVWAPTAGSSRPPPPRFPGRPPLSR